MNGMLSTEILKEAPVTTRVHDVLLLEDRSQTRGAVQKMLSRYPDFNIVSVSTTEEAVSEALDREVTLFVFPDHLTGIDGISLVKALRRFGQYKKTPVVMMTGSEERKVLAECYMAGASICVSTPIDETYLKKVFDTIKYWHI